MGDGTCVLRISGGRAWTREVDFVLEFGNASVVTVEEVLWNESLGVCTTILDITPICTSPPCMTLHDSHTE